MGKITQGPTLLLSLIWPPISYKLPRLLYSISLKPYNIAYNGRSLLPQSLSHKTADLVGGRIDPRTTPPTGVEPIDRNRRQTDIDSRRQKRAGHRSSDPDVLFCVTCRRAICKDDHADNSVPPAQITVAVAGVIRQLDHYFSLPEKTDSLVTQYRTWCDCHVHVFCTIYQYQSRG